MAYLSRNTFLLFMHAHMPVQNLNNELKYWLVLSHRIKLGKKHNVCEKTASSWRIQYGGRSSKERGKCVHAINLRAQMWHQNGETEPNS